MFEMTRSMLGRHGGRPSKAMESIGRKHPAHQPTHDSHNTPIIIFLTVCTKGRKPILGHPQVQRNLVAGWQNAISWMVGRYVIMLDHVHLFCAPAEFPAMPLMHWVRFWKSETARQWPRPSESSIWQRHFWDTQLRRSENYDAKWEYVVQNPVRAGLVTQAADWPYQGELNVLRW